MFQFSPPAPSLRGLGQASAGLYQHGLGKTKACCASCARGGPCAGGCGGGGGCKCGTHSHAHPLAGLGLFEKGSLSANLTLLGIGYLLGRSMK